MPQQEGCQWPELGNAREALSDLWALLSQPFLLILLQDPRHGPSLGLCCLPVLASLVPTLKQGGDPSTLTGTWERRRGEQVAMPYGSGGQGCPGIPATLEGGRGAKVVGYTCHKLFLDH